MEYLCRRKKRFYFIPIMSTTHLSEQEIIRREKLQELNKLGIDAYPAALYLVTHNAVTIKKLWAEDPAELGLGLL